MLYATCPFCSSTLQISDAQLKAKDGLVRCGHCKDIFNASSHLIKVTKPTQQPKHPPENKKNDAAPIAVWETQTSTNKATKSKPYGILSFALALFLGLQFVFFDREQILKNKTLRPYIDQLSDKFELAIPYYQNLNELQIINRSLSPHKSEKNTLHLELSVKNTSNFQQQYPSIVFTLLSDSGEKVAQRTFRKQEYLTDHLKADSFKAQAVVLIELNFKRPQKAAEGFEIAFSN